MTESSDTARKAVKTYVPAYQKEAWKSHADRLGMSQSEFIRTMVQAGRQGFGSSHEEPDTADVTPGVNPLETRVLEFLSDDTYSWDELLETVRDDLEVRLEDTLDELQAENRVRYSSRDGGYTAVGETDGS